MDAMALDEASACRGSLKPRGRTAQDRERLDASAQAALLAAAQRVQEAPPKLRARLPDEPGLAEVRFADESPAGVELADLRGRSRSTKSHPRALGEQVWIWFD